MVKGDQMVRMDSLENAANAVSDQDMIDRIDQALEFHQDRIESAQFALDHQWIDHAEYDRRIVNAKSMVKLNILCAIKGG